MKKIYTFIQAQNKGLFLFFCFFLAISRLSISQTTATENFEGETHAATTFSQSGINFQTTGVMRIFYGLNSRFGANSSDGWLESPIGSNNNSQNVGGFQITNPSTSFRINSFASWTSNVVGGATRASGTITFTGTRPDNSTVTTTRTISPTADNGTGWQLNINFNGTALENEQLIKLEFTLPNNLTYFSIDDISFTTAAIVSNQFSINDVSQNEGNTGTSNFSFTVTRSNNSAASSVQVQSSNGTATAGSDYVAFPLTTVNFLAGGALTQTVNVTVNGDTQSESNETFSMTLSNPVGGVLLDGSGLGTILDDDAITEPFEDETHSSNTFTQGGNNFITTGKLAVRNGGNFGSGGTSAFVAPIEPFVVGNQGSFQITSPGKSFNLLSIDLWAAVVSGTSPNWVFTPTNSTISFTGTRADGSGTVTHSAAITPTGINGHSTVNFVGSPFDGIQLSAIAFSTPAGIQYLQIDNFRYGITALTNTQLSINDVSVIEGTGSGSTTATFTVSRTNNSTAFSVDIASSNGTATAGTDYVAIPTTTLNFTNGGALTQTVNVTILRDATIEPNETFFLTLSNANNGTVFLKQVGIGTILNDDSVIETFEDETNLSTSFSESGVSFLASGGFNVKQTGNFGSGSSSNFLTSINNAVGNMGTITLSTANKAFRLHAIDGWVGTSVTGFSSGPVTFVGTLFGGGTVSATKTITATSATGAGWQQNITFADTDFNNALITSIQVSTGGALTLFELDNLNFTIVDTAPIIQVVDANDNSINNGAAAGTSNNTDFGTVCVTNGLISKTYTIKNSGNSNLILSGSTLAVLGGPDNSHFSITSQPTSPIAPNGSVTFTVQFDPSTAGEKNATVTINNNDATNSPYIINVKGTGAITAGNPSVFGQDTWNVYAWNAGDAAGGSGSWQDNYAGFYTNADLNLNTANQWGNLLSPSAAVNYQGCSVNVDNHSFSAKRRGFPCNRYQLNIPNHDDAVQLFINGVMEFQFIGCCESRLNVWQGNLGPNDTVEIRVAEGAGASLAELTFEILPPIQMSSNSPVCPGSNLNLTSSAASAYSWTGPNSFTSDLQNPQIPSVTAAAGGTYVLTITNPGGCTASSTIEIIINSLPSVSINTPGTACIGTNLVLTSTIGLLTPVNNFVDSYSMSNWSLLNTNADGSINTSSAPNSITIIGGDNQSNNEGRTNFSITIPFKGTISFNWAYSTTDGAQFEIPRVVNAGVSSDMTGYSTFGGPSQSGTMTVPVNAGDEFSFSMFTVDNRFGRASVTISNFSATRLNTLVWTASNGGTISGPIDESAVSVSSSGTYTLTATGRCQVSTSEDVIFNPLDHNLVSPANNLTGTSSFKAVNNINASNKITSPANVTYQAGKSILLTTGFESGAVFKAEIGGCGD